MSVLGRGRVTRLLALFTALVSVIMLVACGEARTAASFCTRYEHDKAHYLDRYNGQSAQLQATGKNGDTLGELVGMAGMSVEMLGSIEDMFSDLAKVSPDDIQTQVEAVRDSIKSQEDALKSGSIAGMLLGSLTSSLESSDDWQQVGTYVETNCHTT